MKMDRKNLKEFFWGKQLKIDQMENGLIGMKMERNKKKYFMRVECTELLMINLQEWMESE